VLLLFKKSKSDKKKGKRVGIFLRVMQCISIRRYATSCVKFFKAYH